MTKVNNDHSCSFCNKSKEDVEKLIVGESAAICNNCVDLCISILDEEKVKNFPVDHKSINPTELKDYIDQ